jgi:hypothetical protein
MEAYERWSTSDRFYFSTPDIFTKRELRQSERTIGISGEPIIWPWTTERL